MSNMMDISFLQAVKPNRFQAQFFSSESVTVPLQAISQQTMFVKADFVNKTLSVRIQQPLYRIDMVDIVKHFIDQPYCVDVTYLDGYEGIIGTTSYTSLKVFEHSFDMSYELGGDAVHNLKLKFKTCDTYPNINYQKKDHTIST